MYDYQTAASADLTLEDAQRIADFGSVRARRKLASNSRCPLTVMWVLSLDEDVQVRASLGLNSAADDFLLNELMKDRCLTVRRRIAGSMTLGHRRLAELMKDTDPVVAERASFTFKTLKLEGILAI